MTGPNSSRIVIDLLAPGDALRVLVCPTAFKESMSARQVTGAMVEGVSRALPGEAIQRMPVSDGGPGLIDAIDAVDGGERREHAVTGPLGGQITARSLWTPRPRPTRW